LIPIARQTPFAQAMEGHSNKERDSRLQGLLYNQQRQGTKECGTIRRGNRLLSLVLNTK
jgi:hypothetical protein